MSSKKMIFSVITGMEERLPYYVAGVGLDYEQENISRPMGHPEFQWIQCRSGKGELFIGEMHYTVGAGQGMLLFPNEPHSYHAIGGNWKVDWIIFHGYGLTSYFTQTMGIKSSDVYYVSSQAKITEKIVELYFSLQRGTSATHICSSLTYQILLDILSLTTKNESSSIDIDFHKLEPVINYINENYHHPLSLEELANIAGITPQYLCNAFKKFTSLTVFEYINLTRIRKSKELLLSNENMLVREIAALSGYSDESYYCAMFRRYEKMSPLEFCSKYRGH